MNNQLKDKKTSSRYRIRKINKSKFIFWAMYLLNILLIFTLIFISIPEKIKLKQHDDKEVMTLFNALTNRLTGNVLNSKTSRLLSEPSQQMIHDKKIIANWFKKNWQLYALNDSELPFAIESLCLPAYEDDLLAYQQAIQFCVNHPLIIRLREQAKAYLPPFQDPGRKVRISVPMKKDQPPPGYAYTCFESEFTNHQVLLFGDNYQQSLKIQLIGAYDCSDQKTYPDMQLNEQQVLTLFNHRARAIEHAVALIQ